MSDEIRCVVAGSRGFLDQEVMNAALDGVFGNAVTRGDELTIISGGARGADLMGEQYAKSRAMPLERYPANWDLYGNSAGYRRNEQMARVATHLVAFWDGKSRGTKHMIDIAVEADLEVRVFDFDGICRYIHHAGCEWNEHSTGECDSDKQVH